MVAKGEPSAAISYFLISLQLHRHLGYRFIPANIHHVTFPPDHRAFDAVAGVHRGERVQTAVITHPVFVHRRGCNAASAGEFRCCAPTSSILHPRAQPTQTVSVDDISHTRALKRKSRLVSAPTGQMSIDIHRIAVIQRFAGKCGQFDMIAPLRETSWGFFAISSQNRMQREHMMQRSVSSITRGPSSTRFGFGLSRIRTGCTPSL